MVEVLLVLVSVSERYLKLPETVRGIAPFCLTF